MLRRSAWPLAFFVFIGGCYPKDSQPPVVSTDAAIVVDEKQEVGKYEWVDDEDQADLVLVVEFFFPRVEGHDTHRFGLRRVRANAERSNETRISRGFAADGASGGHGGSIGIEESIFPTDGHVTVNASIYWRFTNKSEGKFEKDINVPWMKELKEDVGSGATVHCYFEKPKSPAK
jgi:hypothetical protein